MCERKGIGHCIGKGVGIALLIAAAITAFGFLVMLLWNALMPGLFGLKPLHFWQAMGLLLLSKILFGGFHHGGAHRIHRFHRRRFLERWERMSPEERENFRKGFHGRFCGCHHSEPE